MVLVLESNSLKYLLVERSRIETSRDASLETTFETSVTVVNLSIDEESDKSCQLELKFEMLLESASKLALD